jgi:hypothetical protein
MWWSVILVFAFVCCDDVDLSLYDLDSITAETNYTYVDYTVGRTYYFNFRKPLDEACVSGCISKTNISSYGCCFGKADSEQYDFTEDMTGIAFTYGYYGGRFIGTTYINVYCKTGRVLYNVTLKFTCTFFFYFFSGTTVMIINIQAPGGCIKTNDSSSSEKKFIVTWGFFFVLGLSIMIFLYIVIGFLVTIILQKKRGCDMIPFLKYIKEFVLLVKVYILIFFLKCFLRMAFCV